jgi:hypothetical protein
MAYHILHHFAQCVGGCQVTDSINKLETMGILITSTDEKGSTLLTVLPLDEALERAHIRHFDERREVGAWTTDNYSYLTCTQLAQAACSAPLLAAGAHP